jgi:multidrug efflux pump subunit AcrA (membrane-fusion protein)
VSPRLTVTGHLTAFDKVDLFAEVSGLLLETDKRFKEGRSFSKGEVLIHIDDSVYRNNVLAQKSSLLNQLTLLLPDLSIDFPKSAENWKTYLHDFDLEKPLAPLPKTSLDQERYYIASRNIYNQYYSIKSMEETWDKYTIEAPYDGIVSQANINPGTLVRVGQKLGEFTSTVTFELKTPVGVNQVQHLSIGDKVTLTSEDIDGEFKGSIQRINKVIDTSTQTVMVYITTQDKRLMDGMFLTAHLEMHPIKDVVELERNLLIGANQLYTITPDTTLKLEKVHIAGEQNGRVYVQGLKEGQWILAQPVVGAVEGMKVSLRGQQKARMRPNE